MNIHLPTRLRLRALSISLFTIAHGLEKMLTRDL
jgi:hypothetical protein